MDASLAQVRTLFDTHPFYHLPVLDGAGCVVGLMSRTDYLANLSPFLNTPAERSLDRDIMLRPVHQFMSRQVPLLRPEQPLLEAAQVILAHHFSCLPVVDSEQRLLGVLSWKDLLRFGLNRPRAPAKAEAG
ncbi:signal transduction protein [Gallaecimonas xiamenensis 3-C-1]|uniref:Signal transduction protein n=2 Tax=Gallaecimonas TaxID=745410 RepID=K2JZB8_9GAMM|nr:signal transduction protein [Gallaecimonas xiamenensis 3-C-1]